MTPTASRPLLNSQFSILNLSALLLFLLLPLFSFAQPVPHHENVPEEPDAAAALFVRQFKQIIPYYSAEYHLTVTDVALNKNTHAVRLAVRVDADQTIQPEKEYYIPFVAAPDMPWDITLLADNGYDLCLQVNSDRTINNYYGHGGLMVIITNADLIKAVGIDVSKRDDAIANGNLQPSDNEISDADLAQMGYDYLVEYAQVVSARLPMKMGEGEHLVQCYFVDSTLSMTLEYEDAIWPNIKKILTGNLDNIRASRARSMVEDTANNIAISAYVSECSVRHIYRNQAGTDSVDFTISPWMLDYVYSKMFDEVDNMVEPTPDDYLLAAAQQFDRETPYQVDEVTRLVKCSYDTVTHLFVYSYEIPDSTMLELETNPDGLESLRETVIEGLVSGDPSISILTEHIIAAEASINYNYRSPHGRQPIVIVITSTDLLQAQKKE